MLCKQPCGVGAQTRPLPPAGVLLACDLRRCAACPPRPSNASSVSNAPNQSKAAYLRCRRALRAGERRATPCPSCTHARGARPQRSHAPTPAHLTRTPRAEAQLAAQHRRLRGRQQRQQRRCRRGGPRGELAQPQHGLPRGRRQPLRGGAGCNKAHGGWRAFDLRLAVAGVQREAGTIVAARTLELPLRNGSGLKGKGRGATLQGDRQGQGCHSSRGRQQCFCACAD
jgi:hypothetical protein